MHIFQQLLFLLTNKTKILIRLINRQAMRNRQVGLNQLFAWQFVVIIIMITFVYYLTFYEFVLNYQFQYSQKFKLITIIAGHLLAFMSMWAFIKTIITNPGRIPTNWNYPLNYQFTRRYCLICQTWKPQRSHHCITCRVCVLQMNTHLHHLICCIGFYNRKYFIQFLFYSLIANGLFFGIGIYSLICQFKSIVIRQQYDATVRSVFHVFGMFIELVTLLFVLFVFIINAISVIRNKTFIQMHPRFNSPLILLLNMGAFQNFKQVFGSNPFLWFIPISHESYQTVNGLIWPKNI